MKQKFRHYFPLTGDEIQKIWANGFICFDTSVLLNLYRLSEGAVGEFTDVLAVLGGRLWIPYHVAGEFLTRRVGAIKDERKSYEDLSPSLQSLQNKIDNHLDSRSDKALVAELKEIVRTAFDAIYEKMKVTELPDRLKQDDVLDRLLPIVDGRVGEPLKDMDSVIREGVSRYEKKIPPGYLDKNRNERNQCGDFVIWKEMLEHGKATSQHAVLVTNDVKEDWWEQEPKGPRPELRREYSESTGMNIHFYTGARFLEYAKQSLLPAISDKTLGEVRDVEAQEKYLEALRESWRLAFENAALLRAKPPANPTLGTLADKWSQTAVEMSQLNQSRPDANLANCSNMANFLAEKLRSLESAVYPPDAVRIAAITDDAVQLTEGFRDVTRAYARPEFAVEQLVRSRINLARDDEGPLELQKPGATHLKKDLPDSDELST